jgi:ANTAR domain-containing protein/GAF domain-containing protein
MADYASLSARLGKAVAERPPELPLEKRVCEALQELLGGDGASVTVDNLTIDRVTWCSTDERAKELENLQDVLGEGPCRDAFTSRLPVSTGMGRWAASRWPEFIPAAERVLGPCGVLWSLPMRLTGEIIGTISVYRLAGGALAEPIDAAQTLADAAASLLLGDPATTAELPDEGPWISRAVVHQAVGQLMAQFGTGAGDALAMLRSRAFTADAQLAEVARAVLDGTLDLSDL